MERRGNVKSIAFFNNKGGVGKTTLAVNMAYYLAHHHKRKVLFIDCDPQCNSSQVLLPELEWEKIYKTSTSSSRNTILKTVHELRRGNSEVDLDLPVSRIKRFQLDLLPGHPYLALLEDVLSESWGNFAGGNFGAATRTHWASQVVASADYDYVIFDVGPSLGAINRSVLVGSDAFVTPVAPDLFSLYSFENLSTWFSKWGKTYTRGVEATLDEAEGLDLDEIGMYQGDSIRTKFLGYTTQEYLTKYTGGKARTVLAYDKYKKQIPGKAQELAASLKSPDVDLDLGVVPYMFSMVPLAQSAHSPIFSLKASDGLNGAQFNQQGRYADRLSIIGERIVSNLDAIDNRVK